MKNILKKICNSLLAGNLGSKSVRSKLFPINIATHLVIIYLSVLVGYGVYKSILVESHAHFLDKLKTTQVVPDFLKNYSSSAISEQPGNSKKQTLSNRDLSQVLVAADIVESREVADPNSILDIANSGVGAWLATTMLRTGLQSDNLSLVDAMAGLPRKRRNDESEVVPTLEVLLRLYRKTGVGGDLPENTIDFYDIRRHKLASSLAGVAPQLCPVRDSFCSFLNAITLTADERKSNDDVDVASAIKNAMKDTFRHYDPVLTQRSYSLRPLKYNPSGENGDFYTSISTDPVELHDQNWFTDEPGKLTESVFKLSYLLVNELYRNDEVKSARFTYQAFRGEIQLILFILISYLIVRLGWRVIQVVFNLSVPEDFVKRTLVPAPFLSRGDVNNANYEMELVRSRGAIDQLINALPLIGLFGTVYGISRALPNAAAAVSGSGPDAAQSVNALFEQLGLAFVTTAIAVAGVIILEFCWEKIQSFEEALIWKRVNG